MDNTSLRPRFVGAGWGPGATEGELRVLLVEPDPKVALDLTTDLEITSPMLRITHATSALGALQLLIDQTYDIVLVDPALPDARGLSACDAFLAHSSVLPVIVLSDLDEETMALPALSRGIQDWLVKSQVSTDQVIRSIAYSLARRRAELEVGEVRQRLIAISEPMRLLTEA